MDKVKEKKGQIIRRFLSDAVIIGLGGVVLLLFRFVVKPYKRGFFCDDESLKHPFIESTVSSGMLYGIGFALGFVMITLVEAVRVSIVRPSQEVKLYGKLAIFVRDTYLSLVPFLFGAVLEHITTDIGKYSVGRLRPHFSTVCNIDTASLNCSAGYIVDFDCYNEDENKVREVRLSFPSGHASFSSFAAVYLMIYLQRRLNFLFESLICGTLQMGVFSMAWYTCLSRISDYKHHPTDVLAGAIIGTLTACLTAYCVSNLFVKKLGTIVKDDYEATPQLSDEKTTVSIATNL